MADKIVKLKDGNDYLYPQSVLNGIDTSNVIAMSSTRIASYTMAEDGFITTNTNAGSNCYIFINDVEVCCGEMYKYDTPIPCKKGDVIRMTYDGSTNKAPFSYRVFGYKR